MKKLVYILLFVGFSSFSQNIQSLFEKANMAYRQERYNEAVNYYKKIETAKVQSADLYFNMGNAYYKLNQIAPAIYYYEKALLLDPNHSDAINNLKFAQHMTVDAFEKLPKSVFQKINEQFIYPFKVDTWAISSVILAFLIGIFVLIYYFSYKTSHKRIFFVLSVLSSILFLISLSATFKAKHHFEHDKPAIVFDMKVSVKAEPSSHADEVFELHEGAKVQIVEALSPWLKIQLPDGNVGWLKEDHVRKLKE